MKSIKVSEYSRSRSFHDDLILQDQASGERSQDQWSSGFLVLLALNAPTFVFMHVPGGLQFLITSTCFAWHPCIKCQYFNTKIK